MHGTGWEGENPARANGTETARSAAQEIAYVLFMDTVGYTLLRDSQKATTQNTLTALVQELPEVRRARKEGKFIVRPTGDGMALLFFKEVSSPVRAALQLDEALKTRREQLRQTIGAHLNLRMGLHVGPVVITRNINGENDVAGSGIDLAARVMDCGDGGHILLSEDIARALEPLELWRGFSHPAGRALIKNGGFINVSSLHGRFDGHPAFGNEVTPRKVSSSTIESRRQEQERTKTLNRLDREDQIQTAIRIGGTIIALLTAIGIIFVFDPTGENLRRGLAQAKEIVFPASSPTPTRPKNDPRAPIATASPTPKPTAEPTPTPDDEAFKAIIPKLTGNPIAEVRETAKSYKIKLAERRLTEYDPACDEDYVCRQEPEYGRTPIDGRITVYLNAPTPTPTPEPTGEGATPAPPTPESKVGIIIDARTVHLSAYALNGVMAEDGITLLEGSELQNEDRTHYPKSIEEAQKVIGGTPLVLHAALGDAWLKLSAEDAQKWGEAKDAQNKVYIVLGK